MNITNKQRKKRIWVICLFIAMTGLLFYIIYKFFKKEDSDSGQKIEKTPVKNSENIKKEDENKTPIQSKDADGEGINIFGNNASKDTNFPKQAPVTAEEGSFFGSIGSKIMYYINYAKEFVMKNILPMFKGLFSTERFLPRVLICTAAVLLNGWFSGFNPISLILTGFGTWSVTKSIF